MNIDDIPQQPQRQDDLHNQMQDIVKLAHKFGLYDAADFLTTIIEDRNQYAMEYHIFQEECDHPNQYVNDRSQFVCQDCDKELGR
jgi:poly(A) polymerase Pap1